MKRILIFIGLALMVNGARAQIDLMQGRPNSDMHSTSTFFNPVITGVHIDVPYVDMPTGLLRADEVNFASPQQASMCNRLLNHSSRRMSTNVNLQNVSETLQNITHLSNTQEAVMADEHVIHIPVLFGVRSTNLAAIGATIQDLTEDSPVRKNVKPVTPPDDPLPDPIGAVPFAFMTLLAAAYAFMHKKQ